jgi:hypothetical protein
VKRLIGFGSVLADIAFGALTLGGMAVVVVGAAHLIELVVEGPVWLRWLSLSPLLLWVLARIGGSWRASLFGRAPSPAQQQEQMLRETAQVPPQACMEGKLPAQFEGRSDEELREMGVARPDALRCMGAGRYFDAAARRTIAAETQRIGQQMHELGFGLPPRVPVVNAPTEAAAEAGGYPEPPDRCTCGLFPNPPCAACAL